MGLVNVELTQPFARGKNDTSDSVCYSYRYFRTFLRVFMFPFSYRKILQLIVKFSSRFLSELTPNFGHNANFPLEKKLFYIF